MLNDWKWQKIDDSEYRLKDENDRTIACLIRQLLNNWYCRLEVANSHIVYGVLLKDMKSPEEAMWQATIYFNNTCNDIIHVAMHIRDHLPSLHDLRMRYIKEEDN